MHFSGALKKLSKFNIFGIKQQKDTRCHQLRNYQLDQVEFEIIGLWGIRKAVETSVPSKIYHEMSTFLNFSYFMING